MGSEGSALGEIERTLRSKEGGLDAGCPTVGLGAVQCSPTSSLIITPEGLHSKNRISQRKCIHSGHS
jgi:hypothetical protein